MDIGSETVEELTDIVVRHTLRVPDPCGPAGDSTVVAVQFDAALLSVGFTLSPELFARLSTYDAGTVIDCAVATLDTLRTLVGDHVLHNPYFRDFPDNVPDTLEFWADRARAAGIEGPLPEKLNLLALPGYGTPGHDYTEMLAARAEFVERAGDRATVLHAGGPLAEEISALYLRLASATTPGGPDALVALRWLADACVRDPEQPEHIPVRENRAIVDAARLRHGLEITADAPTDILRLACALSYGDATLEVATPFRSLPRAHRRALLAALDRIVADSPAKLGDIPVRRERWKRLGERLHPHEFPQWPHAARVFAVARGEEAAPSFASRLESALAADDLVGATTLLKSAPGMLFRSLDRLLRAATDDADAATVISAVESSASAVSGRVLLSLREHLQNRRAATGPRVFVNRRGRARVTDEPLPDLDGPHLDRLLATLDTEIARRLPTIEHLAVDRDLLEVALPLSDKAIPPGFGLLPRGSRTPVESDVLRFFVYWKEASRTTDFDLSALLLDRDGPPRWLSYTNLTETGAVHSGDITSAPDGASEFIEIDLTRIGTEYVIPQVNLFAGEGFDQVAESFFGYMLREADQAGKPFEPRTVRMKSDLRGSGRVALPLVFVHDDDGWTVTWLHLFLSGSPQFNTVEANKATTRHLVEAILARRPVTVSYLLPLLAPTRLTIVEPGAPAPDDATVRLTADNLDTLKSLLPQ